MSKYPLKKITIVGCPASGKTTLANKLGLLLNIPVYHLDKIFWIEKGGIKQDDFIAQQEKMMGGDTWIIDGNYMKSKSFKMRLSNADTIIFFEFSKIIVYYRLIKRFLKHFNKPRQDMPDAHKEILNWHLIKFIWNYPTKEIRNQVLSYSSSKKVIILNNQKEERRFIKEIK